jgi:hypothetical protein
MELYKQIVYLIKRMTFWTSRVVSVQDFLSIFLSYVQYIPEEFIKTLLLERYPVIIFTTIRVSNNLSCSLRLLQVDIPPDILTKVTIDVPTIIPTDIPQTSHRHFHNIPQTFPQHSNRNSLNLSTHRHFHKNSNKHSLNRSCRHFAEMPTDILENIPDDIKLAFPQTSHGHTHWHPPYLPLNFPQILPKILFYFL